MSQPDQKSKAPRQRDDKTGGGVVVGEGGILGVFDRNEMHAHKYQCIFLGHVAYTKELYIEYRDTGIEI